MNYPNSSEVSYFCPYTSNLDESMSQGVDKDIDVLSNDVNDNLTFLKDNI